MMRAVLIGALALQCAGCGLFGPTPEEELRAVAARQDHEAKREVLLEMRPTEAMLPTLVQMVRQEPDPTVRALAVDALGTLKGRRVMSELRRAAREDPHYLVRKRALTALAGALGGRAESDLKFALENDPDRRVRVEAVKLVADRLPVDAALDRLLAALRDRAGAVRIRAALELKEITGRSLPPAYGPWRDFLTPESGSEG